ncbi:hypothetical protein J5N97_006527 [Dioscorea zingiberensis]|uniref:Uncharacterized protein n=1 Tax=Dioscorea zingiberensis TaxID=325984 RepID=A0A9D5HTP4_9LILI|nr:hypothetical protein J5N97_006527 [Dioscorea zingiberensis]
MGFRIGGQIQAGEGGLQPPCPWSQAIDEWPFLTEVGLDFNPRQLSLPHDGQGFLGAVRVGCIIISIVVAEETCVSLF